MIESPFTKYCDIIDRKMILEKASIEDYYNLCIQLNETDPDYIYNSLIEDFNHRSQFRKNVIMSSEGDQGEGKSLFSAYWAYKLGEIFNRKFDMRKTLYAIPEDLDNGLRDSPFRTTHFLDEYRKKNVGIGSKATQWSLKDYEEQCRWTQKNIIYASPDVGDRSHYFLFRAESIERVENKRNCSKCPQLLQNKCYVDMLSTACKKVNYWERSGYPKNFTFLLRTKRKWDGWLVPRGWVSVPMINHKTAELYEEIKGKNIRRLEKQEDEAFNYKKVVIDLFIEAYKDRIVRPKSSGKYEVASKLVVEGYLYEYLKAEHKYTTKEIDLMVSMVKEKAIVICNSRNKEIEENLK